MRILIVLFGAIGDVTRALPLAVRIKRFVPGAHITWAVERLSSALVDNHPAVDRVLIFERSRKLRGYRDFLLELKGEPKFDITLDLQRHFKSGFTTWSSGSRTRIGFHRRNAKEFNWIFRNTGIPEVDNWSSKIGHYQKFGDVLGLPSLEPLEFGLAPTDDERARATAFISTLGDVPVNRRAGLILGSSWPSRFWFAPQYRDVIRHLKENLGINSVLIGAKGERGFADEILQEAGTTSGIVDLVGKTTLRDLVALFPQLGFAVGSDSGPMHIAAASGIPVISLWGSTSPLRSAPYQSEDLVLQSNIGCSPCYRKNCPGLGRLCMSDIPARAVLALVDQVLEKNRVLQ